MSVSSNNSMNINAGFPVQKIKDFYSVHIPKPNIEELILPLGKNKQNFLLNKLFSRLFVKKFLAVIQNILPLLHLEERLFLSEKLDAFFSLPHEKLETYIRRPEITSMILLFIQAYKIQDKMSFKKLIPHLFSWLNSITDIDNSVCFLKENLWYRNYFPFKQGTEEEILYQMPNDEFIEWEQSLRDGLNIIKNTWIEAYEEISENIFQIMPIRSKGLNPYNYSIHAFRGLILCGKRPNYMLAQSLVHETGHNKFSTVTDIFTLIESNQETTFISPFTNKPRPFLHIFHGIFSFLEDLYISKKMISKVDEISEGSLERYIKVISGRLEVALDIIGKNAPLTENGCKFYHSILECYDKC